MAEFELRRFLAAVGEVAWGRLKGAYGPSDGSPAPNYPSRVLGDVPGALRTLASLRASDDEAGETFDRAMDVLTSHVWHQGTIYEVTPHVVGFLVDLADAPTTFMRDHIGHLLAVIAESASTDDGDEESRLVATQTQQAISREGSRILDWVAGALCERALCIASLTPALHEALVERLRGLATLPHFALVALAALAEPPTWAKPRALAALDGEEPARTAAALLLRKYRDLSAELAFRVDQQLGPGAVPRLRQTLASPFPLPEQPRPAAEFRGPLDSGIIAFVGDRVVLVQVGGRNVTLRWPGSGLAKGDLVRIGISPQGIARVVEHIRADGTEVRRTFDLEGTLIAEHD